MLVGRRSISFTFHTQVGAGSGVAFECTLADAAANASADSYTACSSPATYGNLTDGRYTFRVRAVNEQFADARTFIRVRAFCAHACHTEVHAESVGTRVRTGTLPLRWGCAFQLCTHAG